MADLNRVFLMGRLTRDPELKYSQSGLAVCSFGIAVNNKRKVGDEYKNDVLFVETTAFGRQAETCGEYLSKGAGIFIEGRLKLDQWTDKKTGQKRSKLSVVADRVQFLGKKGDAHADDTSGDADREPGGEGDYDVPF